MSRSIGLRLLAAGSSVLALAACHDTKNLATATVKQPVAAMQGVPTLTETDSDMRSVLLAQQALGPKPIEQLSPQEARLQPTPADGVKKVLRDQGQNPAPEPVAKVQDITIDEDGHSLPARIYTPASAGPGSNSHLPVVVYFHGGGWVIGSLDAYDASARAVANRAHAIVVAVEYDKGPESRFPTAHEEALASYHWVLRNARRFGGDGRRVAVVGESAGGNLAIGVSRLARAHHWPLPVAEVLIYPVAGSDMNTPSYRSNENAKPLNKAMMGWFFKNYLRTPDDARDPLIDVVDAPDLAGLPPTTIITDSIDPLQSEGKTLADRLQAAGVSVTYRNYDGVTHEFFGMGAVVAKARAAEDFVGQQLATAFSAAHRN